MENIKEQIDKMESVICRIGNRQQIETKAISNAVNDLVDNEYTSQEIIKKLSILKESKKVKRELSEEKKMLKEYKKMLQQQYLIQNEEFLSKANAVHKKTGELLVVEKETEKHAEVRRSNHILNTLKKSDVEMLVK